MLDRTLAVRVRGSVLGTSLDLSSSASADMPDALGIPGAAASVMMRYQKTEAGHHALFCGSLSLDSASGASADSVDASTLTLERCVVPGSGAKVVGLLKDGCSRFGVSTDGATVSQILERMAPGASATVARVVSLQRAALVFSGSSCPEAFAKDVRGLVDLPSGVSMDGEDGEAVMIHPGLHLWVTAKPGSELESLASKLGPISSELSLSAFVNGGQFAASVAVKVEGSFDTVLSKVELHSPRPPVFMIAFCCVKREEPTIPVNTQFAYVSGCS